MGRAVKSRIGAVVGALVVVVGFALIGGSQALGAHPWWAVNVGYIGGAAGTVVWLVLGMIGLGQRRTAFAAAVVLVAAGIGTWIGKTNFAASYAEDALAGRFWYYGWIVALAAATVLIAAVLYAMVARRA